MFLTENELRRLTRRERPAAQARILRALGVPFRAHPTDGVLLVVAEAVRTAFGARAIAANDEPEILAPTAYAVDIAAIRAHGTKAKAR